ncbi:MAG: DUF3486 family protein [Peptococcaceae bacterium]|jgi:hypothetical protein|nr:DUF3486 family protein [Peptococcaceae bacterium]MDH7526030.1 DUF3486 family protein [Peptococcaceae bacterium]
MGEQRERVRIKSRVDELPEDIRQVLDEKINDVTVSYQEIADQITKMGYPISKSSIGRYAMKQNAAAMRLKEAYEKTRMLVNSIKENRDIDSSEVATAILMDALTQRIATAEEEFDNMPLDKAGRLIASLQRSIVYKEKFKLEYEKGVGDAFEMFKKEIPEAIKNDPELLQEMTRIINIAKDKVLKNNA